MPLPSALRHRALAALCLGLAACDSGTPEENLLGTWDTQSGGTASYATVSQAQSIRDPNRPGTGGLVVTGDLTGTLRYFAGYAEGDLALVYALDAPFSGEPRLLLTVSNEDGDLPGNVFRLRALDADGDSRTFEPIFFTPAYTFTADAFDLPSVRFRDPETGDEATVAGRLTFARLPLPANEETLVSGTTYDRSESSVLRVSFDADGTYRQLNQDVTTSMGTWAAVGNDEVRVRIGQGTAAYRFEIDGSALTLTYLSTSACDAECEDSVEALLGLAAGTLTSYRLEETRTFRRGSDAAASPPAARPETRQPEIPGWPLRAQ